MAKFGELHTVYVYYKGTTGTGKGRPVLIIDDSEENFITFAEITTTEPNEPPKYYDQFKVNIVEWQKSGLDEPSWVKCHRGNVHRVEKDRVLKYIGVVEEQLLIDVLEKVTNQ